MRVVKKDKNCKAEWSGWMSLRVPYTTQDLKDVREQTKSLRYLGKEHARHNRGHRSMSQRPVL